MAVLNSEREILRSHPHDDKSFERPESPDRASVYAISPGEAVLGDFALPVMPSALRSGASGCGWDSSLVFGGRYEQYKIDDITRNDWKVDSIILPGGTWNAPLYFAHSP